MMLPLLEAARAVAPVRTTVGAAPPVHLATEPVVSVQLGGLAQPMPPTKTLPSEFAAAMKPHLLYAGSSVTVPSAATVPG